MAGKIFELSQVEWQDAKKNWAIIQNVLQKNDLNSDPNVKQAMLSLNRVLFNDDDHNTPKQAEDISLNEMTKLMNDIDNDVKQDTTNSDDDAPEISAELRQFIEKPVCWCIL